MSDHLVSEPKRLPLESIATFMTGIMAIRDAVFESLPELEAYATEPARLMFDARLKVISIEFGPLLLSIKIDPARPTLVGAVSTQIIAECENSTKH